MAYEWITLARIAEFSRIIFLSHSLGYVLTIFHYCVTIAAEDMSGNKVKECSIIYKDKEVENTMKSFL